MPKLPFVADAKEAELLDKPSWDRGIRVVLKPKRIRIWPGSNHYRLILLLCLLVVVLVSFWVVYSTLSARNRSKDTKGQEQTFEYPLNVNDVKFPSDFLKEKFLENFQRASEEKDADIRYKLLTDDFEFLRGFYLSTSSYDYRVQLDEYKDYMKKNYPAQYEKDKGFYDFPCIDRLCGEAKYPPEVEEIIKDLEGNTAVDDEVRGAIGRNFDAAAVTGDKTTQTNNYMNVLSSLYSEYERTQDEGIKSNYLKLKQLLATLGAKIPEQILLE